MKLDVLGPAHSETSNTLQHLAEVRWQQGRREDAAAMLQQSLGGWGWGRGGGVVVGGAGRWVVVRAGGWLGEWVQAGGNSAHNSGEV